MDQIDSEIWESICTFPIMSLILRISILCLNIFLPGIGTMLMGLLAYSKISKTQLAIGVLQFATAWLIIGYVWSIVWGIFAMLKSSPQNNLLLSNTEQQSTTERHVVNPWESTLQNP